MDGVLVVDKPAGPTSHDVVDRVRRAFGTRRVGHTGTLDPFATGVLPVCVGKATRLARFLSESEKVYRASVRLGFPTTTDDASGVPLFAPRPVRVSIEEAREAARAFVGLLRQVPPSYSAKRSGGRRLYELARSGVAVSPAAVAVTVHEIDVVGIEGDRLDMAVRCSAGTYVRALARDLGEALGCGAHLAALRRTWSGGFSLEESVVWDAIDASAAERVVPLGRILPDMPAVRVAAEGAARLRHGRDLTRQEAVAGWPEGPLERVRVLDESGSLLALAVPRGFEGPGSGLPFEPVLHPDVVLVD